MTQQQAAVDLALLNIIESELKALSTDVLVIAQRAGVTVTDYLRAHAMLKELIGKPEDVD